MTSSVEILERLLNEWSLIYGRRMDSEAIAVWLKMFAHTPPKILALALDRITNNCERMPVPATLQKEISKVKEELCDHRPGLTYREGFDAKGVPCVFWSDEPNVPAYRAKGCAEGRLFLAMMEDWKNGPRSAAVVPTEEELQQRKVELLRQEQAWRKRTGAA